MERYEGILRIQLRNVGSRSEGYYPVLIREPSQSEAADNAAPYAETVRLAREGLSYGDNSYFEPFDGLRVRIEGVMSHDWLLVERIVEIPAASDEADVSCSAPDSERETEKPVDRECSDIQFDKERL